MRISCRPSEERREPGLNHGDDRPRSAPGAAQLAGAAVNGADATLLAFRTNTAGVGDFWRSGSIRRTMVITFPLRPEG